MRGAIRRPASCSMTSFMSLERSPCPNCRSPMVLTRTCRCLAVSASMAAKEPLGALGCEQLDEKVPHAAGRSQDQDPLAWPDVAALKDSQGGGPVVEDCGGVEQADIVWHGNSAFEVGHGELGVAAGPSRAAGVGGHLPAEPILVHRLANHYDLPAYPVTRNVRGPDGEIAAAGARPDQRVD